MLYFVEEILVQRRKRYQSMDVRTASGRMSAVRNCGSAQNDAQSFHRSSHHTRSQLSCQQPPGKRREQKGSPTGVLRNGGSEGASYRGGSGGTGPTARLTVSHTATREQQQRRNAGRRLTMLMAFKRGQSQQSQPPQDGQHQPQRSTTAGVTEGSGFRSNAVLVQSICGTHFDYSHNCGS